MLTVKRISPYQNQGYVKKKFGEYDAEGFKYPFGICQWVAKKTYSVYTNPFFMEQFLADSI